MEDWRTFGCVFFLFSTPRFRGSLCRRTVGVGGLSFPAAAQSHGPRRGGRKGRFSRRVRSPGGLGADRSPLHIFRCSVGSKMTRARRFPSPRPGRLFSSVIVLTDEIAFVSLRSVFLSLISFCRARPRSRGPAPPIPGTEGAFSSLGA